MTTGVLQQPAHRDQAPAAPAASWRRWRTPLAITVVIMVAGAIVALARPSALPSYLDPGSTQPAGASALADILAQRGTRVDRVTSASAAVAAAQGGASPVVITSPDLLTGAQLRQLALAPADLVIVEPDQRALAVLAPGLTAVPGPLPGAVPPDCPLAAAQAAGSADLGGTGLILARGARGTSCYPALGLPSLVSYSALGRQVTALGSGAALENQYLDQLGNASLALNLLGRGPRIAWLVPPAVASAEPGPAGGPRSVWQLIPLGAYLVAGELMIAVLLAALWRARRLGPLVAEPLPVVVRAAETTEGHARLYQARRARDRASAALRAAALGRVVPLLGLPPSAPPPSIAAALAARTALSAERLTDLLFGPPPGSDAALVALASDLDAMEREVRAQ